MSTGLAPRLQRRWRKRLLLAGAVALALGLGFVAFVLVVNPSALAVQLAQRARPAVARALGREVTVGKTDATALPFVVRFRDVQVAGAPGEPPLLTVRTIRVSLHLWTLLRSGGKQVELKSLTLREPTVTLVRSADGRWELPAPQQGPAAGQGGAAAAARVEVVDGTLRLIDPSSAEGRDHPVVVRQLSLGARGVGLGRGLKAWGSGALGSERTNLKLQLAVAPVPPGWAALRAHPPRVHLQLDVERAPLDSLRAVGVRLPGPGRSGGALWLHATVQTGGDGVLHGSGSARLDGQLDGHRAPWSAKWAAALDPARAGPLGIAVEELVVSGPGVALKAAGELRPEPPLSLWLQVTGDTLDLDAVASAPRPGHARPPPRRPSQGLQRVNLSGTVALDRLELRRLVARRLRAELALSGGVAEVRRARAEVAGGAVQLDGSRVDLREAAPRWTLKAHLQQIDLGRAESEVLGRQPLTGIASGSLALEGQGTRWEQLRPALRGKGTVTVHSPVLTGRNLGHEVAHSLSGPAAGGAEEQPGPEPVRKPMPLGDVTVHVSVADGWIRLDQPIELVSDFGKATLQGRVGLDQRLALRGSATLTPAFLGREAKLHTKSTGSLAVPLTIGGTLSQPRVHVDKGPGQVAGQAVSIGAQTVKKAGSAAGKAAGKAVRSGRRLFPSHRPPH